MKILGPQSAVWVGFKMNARGTLLGAAFAVATGLILFSTALGITLIQASYDLPFAVRPAIKPTEVVVVYLDEESHSVLEQPYNRPWNRALHGELIRRLRAKGARAVVFDIVFSDPGPDAAIDEYFAEAIAGSANVILAADCRPAAPGESVVLAKKYDPPLDLFGSAAVDYGSAEMGPDLDLINRRHVPMSVDDPIASLSWAAANFMGARVTKKPGRQFEPRWFNYYGPQGTIPGTSFYKVLVDDAAGLSESFFSNKVVFVGARLLTKSAGERKDEFPSPYSRWKAGPSFMPGVDIQATAFLNLMRDDWLRRWPIGAEKAFLIGFGVISGAGLILLRPTRAVLVAVGAAAVIAALNYYFFSRHFFWYPWLLLVAQIAVALLWSILFNSIQLYVQKRLAEQTLALYLSPKLVKKYSQQRFSGDSNMLKPGAEKQLLTILFSDIASFTSISEGMDSDELARLMNKYFETAVSECVHKTDGTVVKYIGDSIFAFWNAPDLQDDHQARACQAALHFKSQAVQFINGQPLVTRIGLHTGVANVGNFGSATRIDYTAIGESINLASRMEGLNKYLGTQILISGQTEAGIRGRFLTRFLGVFKLKGFEKSVEVFELMSGKEPDASVVGLRDSFASGLEAFQGRRFAEAASQFNKVLASHPNDGPSHFYLHQIEELREAALPTTWRGDVELKEK